MGFIPHWSGSLRMVGQCEREPREGGQAGEWTAGSPLQVPKADCCASLQLRRRRWDSYTQSQIDIGSHVYTHRHTAQASNTHSHIRRHKCISAWMFSLVWMIASTRPSQRVFVRTARHFHQSQWLNLRKNGWKYLIFHLNSCAVFEKVLEMALTWRHIEAQYQCKASKLIPLFKRRCNTGL